MKICLSSKRKEELEKRHDKTHDGQVRDRIKALLLASEGWTAKMIAQVLRIHEATVHRHLNDFHKSDKLKPENGGSESHLLVEQTAALIKHLEDLTYHHRLFLSCVATSRAPVLSEFPQPLNNKALHINNILNNLLFIKNLKKITYILSYH